MWISLLILFFIFLIVYQMFLARTLREGLENANDTTNTTNYKEYDPNNVMILAQQNAGNIQVLKKQLDDVLSVKSTVDTLNGKVDALTEQVNGIVSAQQDYAQQNLPSSPPEITGTM